MREKLINSHVNINQNDLKIQKNSIDEIAVTLSTHTPQSALGGNKFKIAAAAFTQT